MSYARFGYDSDVYVFLSSDALECCACLLRSGRFAARSTAEMTEHLDAHRARGHSVPASTYAALEADRAENDASLPGRPMKRYLLFAWNGPEDGAYPMGGPHDLLGDFDELAYARRHLDNVGRRFDEAAVLDTETGDVIDFANSPPCSVHSAASSRRPDLQVSDLFSGAGDDPRLQGPLTTAMRAMRFPPGFVLHHEEGR